MAGPNIPATPMTLQHCSVALNIIRHSAPFLEKKILKAGEGESTLEKLKKKDTYVSAFPTSALPESGSMGISQAQRHPCNTIKLKYTKNINNFAGAVNAHQQPASIPAQPATAKGTVFDENDLFLKFMFTRK